MFFYYKKHYIKYKLNKNSRVMIGPGVVVNPDVFLKEINDFGTDGRSFLDNNCGIIEQHHLLWVPFLFF